MKAIIMQNTKRNVDKTVMCPPPSQLDQSKLLPSGATKQDLQNIEAVINATSGGTVLVFDPLGPQMTRSWCLFEIWATLKLRGSQEFLHFLTPGVH